LAWVGFPTLGLNGVGWGFLIPTKGLKKGLGGKAFKKPSFWFGTKKVLA